MIPVEISHIVKISMTNFYKKTRQSLTSHPTQPVTSQHVCRQSHTHSYLNLS